MVWGEYFALRSAGNATCAEPPLPSAPSSVRAAIALAVAAALAAGCDGGVGVGGEDDDRVGELGVPPVLADSRAIDTDQLSVSLTVGGQPVNAIERRGESFVATFTLPDGNPDPFPVQVTWFHAVTGRAEPVPIARTDAEVRLSDERRLRIVSDSYRFDRFGDADGDGRDDSNPDGDGLVSFAELELGTDPLVSDGARADQGDCRVSTFNGERPVDVNAPRDVFLFDESAPFAETRALDLPPGRLVYHATFVLPTPGVLLIENQSGQPVNTDATLYDRRADATALSVVNSNFVRVRANDTDTVDGVRAVISERIVQRGLYCYALFDEVGADFAVGEALTDIVLRVEFTPEP